MDVLFKTLLKDPVDVCYDGEDKDEKILYVLRQSWITTVRWLMLTGVMIIAPTVIFPVILNTFGGSQQFFSPQFMFVTTLFWYLATFGVFLQNFMNWFFNVYVITNKKIVDVDFNGLLYKNISEAPIENIQDVTSQVSGTTNVIFNVGDVFIQTAAEQTQFEFLRVDNPSKVRDLISDIIADIRKTKQ